MPRAGDRRGHEIDGHGAQLLTLRSPSRLDDPGRREGVDLFSEKASR
jgi:hypothetical protein